MKATIEVTFECEHPGCAGHALGFDLEFPLDAAGEPQMPASPLAASTIDGHRLTEPFWVEYELPNLKGGE